jgi:two-component system sensor histidine kinase YesM
MLRNLPIRGQMYLIAVLTVAVIVSILFYSYNRGASLLVKNNEAYTNEIFVQMEQTIISNYDVVKWLTYNIAYNQSVQDYLLDEDPLSKLQRHPTLKNLLLNLSTVKPGILDLIIVGKNGSVFSLQGNNFRQFEDFMPPEADSYFSEIRHCQSPVVQKVYCFAVGTNIFSSNINNQYTNEIGRIVLLLEASTLTGGYNLHSLQPGTSVYLLDRANTVFMSNERDRIGEPLRLPNLPEKSGFAKINGRPAHVQIKELPQIGGKMVRIIPNDVFFKDIRMLRDQSLLALAAGLLMLMVPFILILNNMIRPLRKLYHTMRISVSKDLHKRIELSGSAEARVIGMRYNQMLSDVRELTQQLIHSNDQLLKAEIEKKQAEFDFLKSQVNPHFLYNTLDVIRGIASERGVPEIREMTGALSRIFRYSITGLDFVTLAEEVRIVEAYMSIQTIRFSHRFKFVRDIPPECGQWPVPKMIVQPIVENAIYHGLEPRYEKGTLILSARTDHDRRDLILAVRDDGVGMSQETLDMYRRLLRQADASREPADAIAGIGLLNVHNRLRHLYGPEYGLEIDSKEREGTLVTIRIPQRRGGRMDV